MDGEGRVQQEDYANWRGRKADSSKQGGILGASLACVVEVFENMVFLSNATNFVAYFLQSMHYPAAESANMVTNFMGTSFLLTIFGGFISDSFLTRFITFIIFCIIELIGLILLTVQAQYSGLQPTMNRRPSHSQAAILYTGLYSMATGVGGIKAALPAHGADQLDHNNHRLISAFFNWYFFSLCTGGLIAATVMVWIEENRGWNWSFKISAVVLGLALCIFITGFPIYRYTCPAGSPITRIWKVIKAQMHKFNCNGNQGNFKEYLLTYALGFSALVVKVIASAIRNRKGTTTRTEMMGQNTSSGAVRSDGKCRFFDKALLDDTVTVAEVNETKTFLGLLPIFASTIMMNCCLAQLQTFSVQQGNIMDRELRSFKIPTQSMSVFPLTIMLLSIPLYERFVHTFGNKISSRLNIFQPRKRIGLGLALASGSMAVAAVVELKRRQAAENHVTLSVFWLVFQYLLLGVSDMLTLGGMLEFFYSEAPQNMRSMSTALSWCSTSMGYFLSSALVSVTNLVSKKFSVEWLGGNDLNHARLDLFYTLLCVLNFINFLNYIYWAKRY